MLNFKEVQLWLVEFAHNDFGERVKIKVRANNYQQAIKNALQIFPLETKSYTKKEVKGFYIELITSDETLYV